MFVDVFNVLAECVIFFFNERERKRGGERATMIRLGVSLIIFFVTCCNSRPFRPECSLS